MNNRIVIPIFVVSIIIAFGVGAIIGTSTINLSNSHTDKDNELISSIDVKSLIRINSQDDLLEKKNNLIEYIWKANGFPSSKMPQNVETTTDSRYTDLQNLDKIEKITTAMENGVNSYAYLFLPKNQNGELLIYHAGHEGDFISGKPTIQFFLNEGYSVLALSMPLTGMNNKPIVNTDFGPIRLETHDHLKFLESQEFSPIKYFVEPVAVSLNYAAANYDLNRYHIVGLSGGGWTAILYSAIDDRISDTYSISGSLPFYLRTESDLGDYEQTIPELYRIANYLELYVLDSSNQNRELVQIFNKYDPCCFSNPQFETYEDEIRSTLTKIGGGKFTIYLDDTHKEHKISDHALQIILNHIKE